MKKLKLRLTIFLLKNLKNDAVKKEIRLEKKQLYVLAQAYKHAINSYTSSIMFINAELGNNNQ